MSTDPTPPTLMIDHWLQALGKATGLAHLALNEKGVCAFKFDDSVDIVIEVPPEGDTLYLYAAIMRDIKADLAVYEQLLRLNYLGRETGGATFALNQRDASLILCLIRPLNLLDSARFFTLLQTFMEAAKKWRLHFDSFIASDAKDSEENPAIDPRSYV